MRAIRIGVGMALVASSLAMTSSGVSAADDDVVISEIHYKPADGSEADFVELTNTGDSTVDLAGWCFTDGFEFCFPASTLLDPGGYTVVTKNLSDFASAYGFSATHEIVSGSVSNGGELIELSNAAAIVVDSVDYLDEAPWPASPDGGGPSLELTDLGADNADSTFWGASLVDGGTPFAVNTIDGGVPGPEIDDVAVAPFRPDPGEAISVTASIAGAVSANVEFVVNFGPAQVVPMVNTAGSTYEATIPAQAAGDLVRYKVVSTDGANTVNNPSLADTINYHGVVVVDPDVSSNVPLFEWFIDEADYVDMLANHRYDDVEFEAVLSHAGVVIDNARVRVRGASTRNAPRPSLKWELPVGHLFQVPGAMDYGVDEFAMQWSGHARVPTAWRIAALTGQPEVETFTIQSQRNGSFWGSGMYLETFDGRWRSDNGFDTGALYKASRQADLEPKPTPADLDPAFNKKTREDEDYTDLWELTQAIKDGASDAELDYLMDNIDMPSVVNYMAYRVLVRHADERAHNYYMYRDTEGTQRWEMLLWDLDFVFWDPTIDQWPVLLRPDENSNELQEALMRYPDIEEMMFRRLRTIADQYLYSDIITDLWESIHVPIADATTATRKIWPYGQKAPELRERFEAGIAQRRALFANKTRSDGMITNGRPIPLSQTAARPIVISELHIDPAGSGVEFIELTNTSSTESFDLSDWTIEGLEHTIDPGTVILPDSSLTFVSNDVAFRDFYPPMFIGGEFSGSLSDSGETITLVDAGGAIIDEVPFGSDATWPAATGIGRSLSLSDTAADNADGSNWGVSLAPGGSPGEANVLDPNPPQPPVAEGLVILNEWNSVAADSVLKNGGSDLTFGQVVGNGGDWFELVVVDEGLDLRGWQLQWSEAGGPSSGSLTLADDPLWASLPAGAIVTVSEDQVDDLSFDPVNGDWSINVQAPGQYVSGAPFDVTNSDWQLTIVDDNGVVSFGPAGEGVSTGGVGSTEIGALQDDPSDAVTPLANYDDLINSTWGLPNPNDAAGVQDFSSLRNLAPPSIVDNPANANAVQGEDAVFSVVASGTSPFAFQWFRDGSIISGATSSVLTIPAVTVLADDGATFTVQVSNAFGDATSSSALLTVTATPPRATTGLTGLWTFDDAPGSMVSDTSGFGTPLPLTIGDPSKVSWLPGGGLAVNDFVDISSAVPADKIADASAATGEVTLEVWVDPADVSGSTGRRLAGLMGPGVRSIALSQGFFAQPSSSLGVRLRTGASYGNSLGTGAGTLDGSLVHIVVTRESGGLETIYVDGVAVSSQMTSGALTWTQALPMRIASDGQAGAAFTGDIFVVATYDQALSISEVGQNFAAGPVGEPPAPAVPSITLDPTDLSISEGDIATFSAAASGVPTPNLQWRRDGVDLVGENGSTLEVGPVGLADDGAVFDVVATNGSGSDTSAPAMLTVTAPTGITVIGDPTVTVTEGIGLLDVSWLAVADASMYQLRYRPAGGSRQWDAPTTAFTRQINGLSSGITHSVEVRALIGSAWGPWTTVSATPA